MIINKINVQPKNPSSSRVNNFAQSFKGSVNFRKLDYYSQDLVTGEVGLESFLSGFSPEVVQKLRHGIDYLSQTIKNIDFDICLIRDKGVHESIPHIAITQQMKKTDKNTSVKFLTPYESAEKIADRLNDFVVLGDVEAKADGLFLRVPRVS